VIDSGVPPVELAARLRQQLQKSYSSNMLGQQHQKAYSVARNIPMGPHSPRQP
jgi:hypothetical protein